MHIAFALPDPADAGLGGGTDYVSGLVDALQDLGHRVTLVQGTDPLLPSGALTVIDGMILPTLATRLDELHAAGSVALIHHVGAAAGRDEAVRERIHAIEAQMLPQFRRVIATSQPVADRLAADFGITAPVVSPGARDLPRSTNASDEPLIISVGVLTRRKGHARLLHALARLTDLSWRATILGDANRDPAHAAELAALIAELGLTKRVALCPDPDPASLQSAWQTASVFALATSWEGYPAAVAEALRRGIPTIVSEAGDPGRLVPPSAGAAIATDDMVTFGKCLRRMVCDTDLRTDMAEHAWRVGQALPDWPAQARAFAAMLEA